MRNRNAKLVVELATLKKEKEKKSEEKDKANFYR